MENDLQKRIDETLNVAGKIKSVSPKPFFFTRLKARMDDSQPASVVTLIPVPLRAVCAIVLVVNAVFFLSSSLRTKRENTSEQLASFYQFNSNSIYSN